MKFVSVWSAPFLYLGEQHHPLYGGPGLVYKHQEGYRRTDACQYPGDQRLERTHSTEH